MKRTRQFQIRLSAKDKRMLKALSERSGLSMSDVLRQTVRREYAARKHRDAKEWVSVRGK